MNLNAYKQNITDFLMVDVFNSVYKLLTVFFSLCYDFNFISFKVFIKSVYVKDTNGLNNITNKFLTSKSFTTDKDYIVYINWIYNFIEYYMVYNSNNPVTFLPYSLPYLNKRHRKKYISVLINDKIQSDEYFNYFIKFAGPDHEFYNSKPPLEYIIHNYNINTKVELLQSNGLLINYHDI